MKKTVFHDTFLGMGGKMVPFAGFDMPVEFSGVKSEHVAVRHSAGIFDVSHMGEVRITGKSAADFVQYLTTNDVRRLQPGMVQYSCFPNGKGGIIDDLLVYKMNEHEFLLVVNASNIDKDYEWLLKNKKDEEVDIVNESDATSQLALQGPNATRILQKITDIDLNQVPYYQFAYGNVAGEDHVLVSNTGYTGSGGYEIYFPNAKGLPILEAIMEAGKEFDIVPAGLAARDTLRLEMGFCLYGNDIDDNTSPLEAGLGWITRFVEGNDFIDRKRLETQKKEGLKRKLVGFELMERGIARNGYEILDNSGELTGTVTSGTMSPLTGKSIGLGYVHAENAQPGTEILIQIRNKQIPASVVKPPFYQPS